MKRYERKRLADFLRGRAHACHEEAVKSLESAIATMRDPMGDMAAVEEDIGQALVQVFLFLKITRSVAILQMPKQCRGGAWGNKTFCKYHEGLPIDPETHLCIDGRELYRRSLK